MKELLSIATLSLACALCGCATTTVTETEYGEDGETIVRQKVSEQSGNPFVIMAANSANKSWALRQGGWRFNVGYDPSANSVGISGGTVDNMLTSVVDSKYGVQTAGIVPEIYAQSKYSISVSKGGVESEQETEKGK